MFCISDLYTKANSPHGCRMKYCRCESSVSMALFLQNLNLNMHQRVEARTEDDRTTHGDFSLSSTLGGKDLSCVPVI